MLLNTIAWTFLVFTLVSVRGDQTLDLTEVDVVDSLLDRQIPEDVIYDLGGRKKLITRDELTDQLLTFMVTNDENGLPVVFDPDTGHKYLVKSSIISKDVEMYRLLTDVQGRPIVADWETRTINRIKINKYKEVELIPVKDEYSNYKFGDLNVDDLKTA